MPDTSIEAIMSGGAFNNLTDVFESIVDWPRRLANETPFYRRLFERLGVKSVIDVACGTGHHAAMFHSWGLRVEGADLSPNMIAQARARFGQPPGLRWTICGYDQPIEPDIPFDAAVCVGNSLALAPDPATIHAAIGQFLAAVRPGGVVVIHVLNVSSLPDGPCVWQKCAPIDLPDGPALAIKGIHRCQDRAYVELLVSSIDATAKLRSHSIPFQALDATDLVDLLRAAGASKATLLGGYQEQAYDRQKSADLIVVAEK